VPICQRIIWMDIAADILKDLKTRFGQGDLLCISDLQLEAYSLCQGELTMTEYFTKLQVLWNELENFRPDPICSCPTRCSCKVSSIIVQQKQEDQAMQFLCGLNTQYANVKSMCFSWNLYLPSRNFFLSLLNKSVS